MLNQQSLKKQWGMTLSKKHNYHDYKSPSNKPLPDDINELPVNTAARLDPSGEFFKFMQQFIDRKLFGDVNFVDPTVNPPRLTASFEFHSGMCKKFRLISYMGDSATHSLQTILNDKIDFRKENKNG